MDGLDLSARAADARYRLATLALAAAAGLGSFAYYFRLGLTNAHYDAKAHLVIARRLSDALAPGYNQMGTHWLPLIHLVYWPFTLFDGQYHSGILPSLISVASFCVAALLIYRIGSWFSGSAPAGFCAAIMFIANPNLQYLQSCPLTEPVATALMLLSLDAFLRWCENQFARYPWSAAIWAALAGMCRYEGWYFVAGLGAVLFWIGFLKPDSRGRNLEAAVVMGGVFLLPIAIHFGYLWLTARDSFLQHVVAGNPSPYETYKRPFLSLLYHLGELAQIATVVPLILGLAGTTYCALRIRPVSRWAPLLVLWTPALLNISALYWGLVYRVRYSSMVVPAIVIFGSCLFASACTARRALIAASLIIMGLPWISWYFPQDWRYRDLHQGPGILVLPIVALACFLWGLARPSARWALLLTCTISSQIPALAGENLAILEETLEHQSIEGKRREILGFLQNNYDSSRILIDIGKLAPLIYDSRLAVREFVYDEGDPTLWRRALAAPELEVGWICVQIGDELHSLLQVDRLWGGKYSLVVETKLLQLYRLNPRDRERLLAGSRTGK